MSAPEMDAEFTALSVIVTALNGLDEAARSRVLGYIDARFGRVQSSAAPHKRSVRTPGPLSQRIVEFLGATPGASNAEVARATGRTESVAHVTLRRLVANGIVRRDGFGYYCAAGSPVSEAGR